MTGDLLTAVGQGRQHIGELLVNLKKIDRNQLQTALSEQAKLNSKLGEVLVQKGFISHEELELALALQNNRNPQAPMMARRKLGDLLLETGKISQAQLEAALQTQDLTKQKIGEVLLEMGFVTQKDIDSALSVQDNLAFSSRQRVLDSLQARSAGEAAQVRQTGPLPTELAAKYATKQQFLDAAAAKAFASAFGRAADPHELAELRSKLAFVFGDNATLNGPLSQDFNRAAAFGKLNSYFQNVIADRIIQLAGGDAVHKVFDRQGNVEISGLSPRDLEIAAEVVTTQGYDPRAAMEAFLERSPRAFFRAVIGRDFASESEAQALERALDGPQAQANRDALRRLQGLLRDTFGAFALAWSDRVTRGQLLPTEAELLEYLKRVRDLGEKEALRLYQEKEAWFRRLEVAAEAEAASKAQLETIKIEHQVRKILEILERILGRIPAALMRMIRQLLAMAGTGNVPNLGQLEAMILNLVEQIMQMFQSKMGRSPTPDELAQCMEAALGAVMSGAGDPLEVISRFLDALKDGKSLQGGLTPDRAMALVNKINFEYKGEFAGGVDENDPWVQALVDGSQDPGSMEASYEQYYRIDKNGLGLPQALAFVEFLNLSYKGVKMEADPFDATVQRLMTGAATPGDVNREWAAIFKGEGDAPPSLDTALNTLTLAADDDSAKLPADLPRTPARPAAAEDRFQAASRSERLGAFQQPG